MKKLILKTMGFLQCYKCNGWFDTKNHVMGIRVRLHDGMTKHYCGKCN